ncbi:5-formyltetrahydrofolate cyclo-ligase [Rubellimicrobium thermophilum DSM 16684]|uniref:5-formyltetrahydrofolate cyclo-ligase n=1 Tax=Rubellimicrobium thermophilum DSM 16684 TaxID=1123069 RepID=S9SN39_9RHOB|nr:5-formyltetrahydrofolate cyclo-ligase [Rubellimicrobium thermophilum]EPX87859.1 5-formyltetrahydrofolate cyclo-ligase [Rubellimicrobium thermophilum DSM 16684]
MKDLASVKATARAEAFARRQAAWKAGHPDPSALLREVLARHRGEAVAGYWPMRSEIDPRPALAEAARHGPVGLPVMVRKGAPLRFRAWKPGVPLVEGGFGTLVPEEGDWIVPRVLVVPLVAFDRRGGRLGYGGGFYDRTLAALRAAGPVTAIGFAWAAQEDNSLPLEQTDALLDLVVTEAEIITPARS